MKRKMIVAGAVLLKKSSACRPQNKENQQNCAGTIFSPEQPSSKEKKSTFAIESGRVISQSFRVACLRTPNAHLHQQISIKQFLGKRKGGKGFE